MPNLEALDEQTGLTLDEQIVARARKRYDRAVASEQENRAAGLEDLRFKRGNVDDQWDGGVVAKRRDQKRPCITVNKCPTFVKQVTNEERQNRPGANVSPIGERSDKKTAEILNGMLRAIDRDSDADIAFDTGFDNAVSNGFGYWRIIAEDVPWEPGVPFNQQRLRIKRIRNPFTVYLDDLRQQPDGSDSKWGFVTELKLRAEFKVERPEADDLTDWDTSAVGENYLAWSTSTHIRVAEYFETVTTKRTLVALRSGHIGYEDDLNEADRQRIKDTASLPEDSRYLMDKREMQCKKIMWYLMTGAEILDRTELPIKWIPIVECVGDEIDIEGAVTRSGVIRPLKGPQQMYNYTATANVEAAALTPKAPYLMTDGQDEGYENEWDTANTENYARLHYRQTDSDGRPAPMPQRQPTAQINPAWVELQNSAAQDMMAVTGIRFGDATKGERFSSESGIALTQLHNAQQLGTFNYIDNFSRSLRHTRRIELDWIPYIWDQAQMLTIVHENGKEEQVMIDPTLPTAYARKPTEGGKTVKAFNPKVGSYDVVITIGPNFQTRQQEATTGMMNFGKAFPNKADLIADLVARNQDWPGSDEIAKRIEMTLPPEMLQPEESDMEPQVQALIASQRQQIQQLSQVAQQMQAALQDKSAELQLQKEKIDRDFEAAMQATAAKLEIAMVDQVNQRMIETQKLSAEFETSDRQLNIDSVRAAAELMQAQQVEGKPNGAGQ